MTNSSPVAAASNDETAAVEDSKDNSVADTDGDTKETMHSAVVFVGRELCQRTMNQNKRFCKGRALSPLKSSAQKFYYGSRAIVFVLTGLCKVRESQSQDLKGNLTSPVARFSVTGLEAGAQYQAALFSYNAKGRSEPAILQAATLRKTKIVYCGSRKRGDSKGWKRSRRRPAVPCNGLFAPKFNSCWKGGSPISKHESSAGECDSDEKNPDIIPQPVDADDLSDYSRKRQHPPQQWQYGPVSHLPPGVYPVQYRGAHPQQRPRPPPREPPIPLQPLATTEEEPSVETPLMANKRESTV
ncbi:unnamed protein product [Brassicogethes aeneus]|uniref:Fibronectin type-III domain-containing protein n=1 Tax=Brassicogethes aeneus TaxID=1431903 RepID=A0A9P0AXC7_BRAAE|nr:unnamed protein product [Brassicogethes aeneus]